MQKSFDIKFEKAIRFLVKYLPVSKDNSRKPILAHDIRVGMYLYENNYSEDLVLAGILHDILEFSEITEDILKKEFGENILRLIKANSKERSIKDSDERINELIKRCAEAGEEALIIKTADILDSFKHYTKTNNQAELEYCQKNAEAILRYKKDEFNDPIFGELDKWLN